MKRPDKLTDMTEFSPIKFCTLKKKLSVSGGVFVEQALILFSILSEGKGVPDRVPLNFGAGVKRKEGNVAKSVSPPFPQVRRKLISSLQYEPIKLL